MRTLLLLGMFDNYRFAPQCKQLSANDGDEKPSLVSISTTTFRCDLPGYGQTEDTGHDESFS